MATMLASVVWTLFVAGSPPAKLPSDTAKEMTEVLVAVNKALGLESWTAEGEKPCVDRGGLEANIKDVSPEDTRQCAATAISKDFSGLGKDYVLGIAMAEIGPVTAFAIGVERAEGWGTYSCDPARRCNPTKLNANSKPAKRLAERYRKACMDPRTVWFPDRDQVCAGVPMSAPAEAKHDADEVPTVKPSQTIQTKTPVVKPENQNGDSPWPVKN
jgi:hypothetical protein